MAEVLRYVISLLELMKFVTQPFRVDFLRAEALSY